MTCTRINAEPAAKKAKVYSNAWGTSITFYMHTGSHALVLFNQSTLYGVWNNPTETLIGSIQGTMSGLSVSRSGYPGNVTLSWPSNYSVAVLYLEP